MNGIDGGFAIYDPICKEREVVTTERLCELLDPHFHIKEQHEGTHFTGKRMRADLLIAPKDTTGWKNQRIVFVVEIKRGDASRRGWGECSRHAAQSVDYANTRWDGLGHLIVLSYPIWLPCNVQNWETNSFVIRLLGQMGAGAICVGEHIDLILSGHSLWNSKQGIQEGKHWGLERKFGSR